MTTKRLRNSAHVQEGRGRFNKPDPAPTFWETVEEQKARNDLYRKLQFFPTQPWTVRALLQLLREMGDGPYSAEIIGTPCILDPCAGRGHMTVPLREAGMAVRAMDIYDFGKGYEVQDFLTWECPHQFDFVFKNPPFSDGKTRSGEQGLAERFVRKALTHAPEVFCLARLGFLEPFGQRHDLHTRFLTDMYVNTERCDMVLGRYDPKADTATPSAWYRFRTNKVPSQSFQTHLIPPGLKARFMKPEDVTI